MVSLYQLLAAIPLLLIFISYAYFLGAAWRWCVSKKSSYTNPFVLTFGNVFFNGINGILLTICLYACIKTNFNTLLLPLPLVLFFLIRNADKVFYTEVSLTPLFRPAKLLLFSGIALVIYWGYYASGFISFDPNKVKYITADTTFYGRLAHYLNVFGNENSQIDFLGLNSSIPDPYHYGDIWLISLMEYLTGWNSILANVILAQPLWAFLYFCGVVHYLSMRVTFISKYYHLLAVFTTFLSGFAFLFPKFILNADVLSPSLSNTPKLYIIACLFLLTTQLLAKSAKMGAFISLSLCGLLFINTLPAICILQLFLCLMFLLKKEQTWRQNIFNVLPLVSVVLYIGFFYSLQQTENSDYSLVNENPLFDLRTSFNIIIGGLFQYTVFIPFLILGCILYFKKRLTLLSISNDISFLLLFPLAGLVAWSLLYPITNEAMQFFHNLLIPSAGLFIIVVVVWAVSFKSTFIYMVGWILLLCSLIINGMLQFNVTYIAKEELNAARHFLNKYPSSFFINIQGEEAFDSFFEKNTVVGQPLIYLNYLTTPYVNISMDAPWIKIDSGSLYANVELASIQNAPFTRYIGYNNIKKEERDSSIMRFVQKYNIHFLSLPPGVLIPEILTRKIKDSVVLPQSQWRLYYLNI